MRERHETDGDRQNEQIICSFWLNRRRLANAERVRPVPHWTSFQKLPETSYKIDYAVLDQTGQVSAWLEVKNRPTGIPYDLQSTRNTLLLSVLKWNALVSYYQGTGRPSILLVRFSDGQVGSYTFKRQDKKAFRIEWGGRTVKTRDAGDIEPVIHIPLERFRIWGTLPDEEMA